MAYRLFWLSPEQQNKFRQLSVAANFAASPRLYDSQVRAIFYFSYRLAVNRSVFIILPAEAY